MAAADEFLAHYGVPGMKWGKHKAKNAKNAEPAKPLLNSMDHTLSRQIKTKHVSEMTNDELRYLTQRMQLEKQYKDLTPSSVNKGKKYLDTFISSTDKANKLVKFVESPAGKLIGKGIAAAAATIVVSTVGAKAGAAAGPAAAKVVSQLAIGR